MARCVPEDLRDGRELESGAWDSCTGMPREPEAQLTGFHAQRVEQCRSEVGRIYVSHQLPGIQSPPGSPFRNPVLYETTEGLQERKDKFSHDL